MTRTLRQRFGRRRVRSRRTIPDEVPAPIVDRGPFAHAFCGECGWEGPGRRSRGLAAKDADGHTDAGCPGLTGPLPEAWQDISPDDPDQLPSRL